LYLTSRWTDRRLVELERVKREIDGVDEGTVVRRREDAIAREEKSKETSETRGDQRGRK
jgi:hypothetical protein